MYVGKDTQIKLHVKTEYGGWTFNASGWILKNQMVHLKLSTLPAALNAAGLLSEYLLSLDKVSQEE